MELLVAHCLRVKGFASDASVAEATGLPIETVAAVLAALGTADEATYRDGRISGWRLTSAGRERFAGLVGEELAAAGCSATVEGDYEAFLPLNKMFKQICTDWQLRGGAPNDHSDTAYDAAVLARIQNLHTAFVPIPQSLTAVLVRFGPYAGRFQTAADRIAAGDTTAIARPLSGSYHDVWMEFHQDLLITLGRDRTEADL